MRCGQTPKVGVFAADMSHDVPRPRFIAYGELLWDLFPDGARLGGAAANAAYHAACLGAESLLVSRVGSDELGARAVSELTSAASMFRPFKWTRTPPPAPCGSSSIRVSRATRSQRVWLGIASLGVKRWPIHSP